MPLDFPAAPDPDDEYTFGDKTWKYNGTGWELVSLPSDLVFDLTPQLGGDLDLNGFDITGSGDIAATVTLQGRTVTLADAGADAIFGWDDSANAYANLSAADARTALDLASLYQPLDSDLTSWAGVTRASGFDTFTATPSSANLASLVTGETGSGALVFGTSPGFTTAANPVSSDAATLGTTALPWSDLYLASGGIVYINQIPTILTANITFYVRSDGSDANLGTADNAGGAFLTYAAAMAATRKINRNGYTITVQSRLTTTTEAVALPEQCGDGASQFLGDTSTPTNRVISTTSANAIQATGSQARWLVDGFKLQTTTTGDCVRAIDGAYIELGSNMNFGACADLHAYAFLRGAQIRFNGGYTISGGADWHKYADESSEVSGPFSGTVTLSGTPAFATAFAEAWGGGTIEEASVTYSGAATGKRFNTELGGIIITWSSGNLSYYPGDVAGTFKSGGQYDGSFGFLKFDTTVAGTSNYGHQFDFGTNSVGELGLLKSDDSNNGPGIITYHASPGPAASDLYSYMECYGKDSAGNAQRYSWVYHSIVDPISTTEDAKVEHGTTIAGSGATRLVIGAGLYHPSATGTDHGNNTINFGAVYDDNVLLTCYPWEAAKTGAVDLTYWDSKVDNIVIPAETKKIIERAAVTAPVLDADGKDTGEVTLVDPAVITFEEIKPEEVIERNHEPARLFAARLGTEYDPTTIAGQRKHIEDKKHLTPYPNPDKYTEANRPSLGGWLQRGVEMDELLFVYIDQLEKRIAALEGRA